MIVNQTHILNAALPAIAFDGWTMQTLENSAKNIGLTEFDVRRAFPGGVAEAIQCFYAQANMQMVETLRRDYQLSGMKVRERIATAVMVYLRLQLPHREAMRRAIGYSALPWNAGNGMKALYSTADAIWHEAGDTATDYNFYTKRLLLSGVIAPTVNVWLEDRSENLADTEAFLRRRIENVMQIEKLKAKAKEGFAQLRSWLPGAA